jgi:hypothetical protein
VSSTPLIPASSITRATRGFIRISGVASLLRSTDRLSRELLKCSQVRTTSGCTGMSALSATWFSACSSSNTSRTPSNADVPGWRRGPATQQNRDYFTEDEGERAGILEDRDEYISENVFWVPAETS